MLGITIGLRKYQRPEAPTAPIMKNQISIGVRMGISARVLRPATAQRVVSAETECSANCVTRNQLFLGALIVLQSSRELGVVEPPVCTLPLDQRFMVALLHYAAVFHD